MKNLFEEFKLEKSQIDAFEKYENLLLEWNEKFNLTAITKPEEIEEKHFVDSLEILKYFDLKNKTLLDVGTGAGFPGIVLAIAEPKLKVTLLESNGKKVSFLKEVISQLKLKNIDVVQGRAEVLKQRENFDVVTARAVKELNILLEIAFHLVKVGGSLIAYKGSNGEEEVKKAAHALKALQASDVRVINYELPVSKDGRTLVEVKKNIHTIKKYPRDYSEIVKKPLWVLRKIKTSQDL